MRALAAAATALALAGFAHAQDPVAQVPQTVARSAVASAPEQIGATAARDRAAVTQLPTGLADRGKGKDEASPSSAAPPASPGLALAAPANRQGSVDADEIARLLARGEAASIDAAAAVALGATSGVALQDADALEERQNRARAGAPHTFVIGDK